MIEKMLSCFDKIYKQLKAIVIKCQVIITRFLYDKLVSLYLLTSLFHWLVSRAFSLEFICFAIGRGEIINSFLVRDFCDGA